MARIYYSNPTAKSNNAEAILAARDWLVNHSNGNLTAFGEVETINDSPCCHLKFQNSGLYIRITQNSSSTKAIYMVVLTRNGETWGSTLVSTSGDGNIGGNGNVYTLEYAEIDDCLFRIGFFDSSYKGSLGFSKFSVQGKQYIGLMGISYRNFFRFSSEYTYPNIKIYDTLEQSAYSTRLYRLSSSSNQMLGAEDALLCPIVPYARVNAFEQGTIEWYGNTGRNLYYLNTSQGSEIFESGANYIINGQSYKACAQELYVFL